MNRTFMYKLKKILGNMFFSRKQMFHRKQSLGAPESPTFLLLGRWNVIWTKAAEKKIDFKY